MIKSVERMNEDIYIFLTGQCEISDADAFREYRRNSVFFLHRLCFIFHQLTTTKKTYPFQQSEYCA